jgi:hypothetical protein
MSNKDTLWRGIPQRPLGDFAAIALHGAVHDAAHKIFFRIFEVTKI